MKRWSICISLMLVLTELASAQLMWKPEWEKEADRLIGEMTIEEKVGQMTQINLDVVCVGGIYNLEEPHRIDSEKLNIAIQKWHVGSVLNCGGHAYEIAQWREIIGAIQNVATTKTRLGIPVLYGIDAIHGANYVMHSTLFPQQIGQAATFNPELTRKGSEITAYETRAAGIPWNFSPVLDVARNPNWSRVFETYGEDPFVCSTFGKAAIIGYQGASFPDDFHVAACMKHFLGYSAARTGRDRTPAIISDMELREIYLPSFKAAIETGALSVMINSGEINGIPVHANPKILTKLLRDELKFQGVAVTDWEDVMKLHVIHHITADMKGSVKSAVDAGIDMCMVPNDFEFARYLIELVKDGQVKEERLNLSVRRILLMKMAVGLIQLGAPTAAAIFGEVGSVANKKLAQSAAEESITLLKNDHSILPLKKETKILVCGPGADDVTALNGSWTRTWQGVDKKYEDPNAVTVFKALKADSKGSVSYELGCSLDAMTDLKALKKKAKSADVIVVCLAEKPSTEKPGDIDELALPAAQRQFVHAVKKLGKPIVLVLLESRPRIVHDIALECQAIVMAYRPGEEGGKALSRILFGDVNPSGKLPFTYPAHEQSLILYDHKSTEDLDQEFKMSAFKPEWEFGHGMSYANLSYSKLKLSTQSLVGGAKLIVTVDVTNGSTRDAFESVLLFSHDVVASVTPSVKKLRAFQKVNVPAGKTTTVTFELSAADLSFISDDLRSVTEDGDFEVMIGNLKQPFTYKSK